MHPALARCTEAQRDWRTHVLAISPHSARVNSTMALLMMTSVGLALLASAPRFETHADGGFEVPLRPFGIESIRLRRS